MVVAVIINPMIDIQNLEQKYAGEQANLFYTTTAHQLNSLRSPVRFVFVAEE
jgi:hypothetical protein